MFSKIRFDVLLRDAASLGYEADRKADDFSAIDAMTSGLALAALGELAVPSLVAALDDEDVWIQRAAASALCKIGGDTAVLALESLLLREDSPKERRNLEWMIQQARKRGPDAAADS